MDKILPIFDDLEGEEQEVITAAMLAGPRGEDDYADAMEAAYQYAQGHLMEFMEFRSVFLTTGVSGLFHLFEKQLYRHLNDELPGLRKISDWKFATQVVDFLNKPAERDGLAKLYAAFHDPDLNERRLVANAVKHGASPIILNPAVGRLPG